MNHVNLIGEMTSVPKIIQLKDGKRIIQFSLSTKETYFDKEGNQKADRNWHRVAAWGKWVPIIEKLCDKGQALAIEGRLKSRFFSKNGKKQSYNEIEINDMVIL